ncbi:hypothetical protein [Paenibacillus cucumis (ex Kampfer et al. 2016)]|uniref:Uncharacterized protein n=1 Tax=Paenibacillus cucumis (ex Kampfer et al. 2016) TaxID=1776858 RepID=A0ABS7KRQ9_9BACL|nr:hypothetical protein [Paenibacillus cucumis (ex Kampfer et al. 2016)]MBY0206857.1 hypothetical protein [Paenibacillus cucumis (ex Kampfer et al. 2016)]
MLLISAGFMFLVYPQSTTGATDQQIKDRRFLARWIGVTLIVMSCLFLMMGTMQLFDQSSHYIGH